VSFGSASRRKLLSGGAAFAGHNLGSTLLCSIAQQIFLIARIAR